MLTLTLGYIGEYYLVMRSSLLDVLGEDYITTIRAKGVREDRVLWRHAVRNAMLPTISLIALSFGFVIGGAITVELVFSYPGLGLLTIQAIDSQDFLLLQGLFLFFSVSVLVSNLVADLAVQLVRSHGCGRPDGGRTRRPRLHPRRSPRPRRIVRTRGSRRCVARRRIAAERFWATYRRSAMGIAGLVILVVFALGGPARAGADRRPALDVTEVDGPILAPPSLGVPARAPTTSGGPCSRSWSGARGYR